ncbi:MAG TPA: hypothetical protein DEQ28_03925 [Clostridiales bacterium]|nr:hypothetical protein [Clostridiales bacterium]
MNDDANSRLIEQLNLRLTELTHQLQRTRLADYVSLVEQPRRMVLLNFVAGVARGVGFAIGFTILGAMVLYLLQRVLALNLPVVGGFIAAVIRIVEEQLARSPPRP